MVDTISCGDKFVQTLPLPAYPTKIEVVKISGDYIVCLDVSDSSCAVTLLESELRKHYSRPEEDRKRAETTEPVETVIDGVPKPNITVVGIAGDGIFFPPEVSRSFHEDARNLYRVFVDWYAWRGNNWTYIYTSPYVKQDGGNLKTYAETNKPYSPTEEDLKKMIREGFRQ